MNEKYLIVWKKDGEFKAWTKQTTDKEPFYFESEEKAKEHVKRLITNRMVSIDEIMVVKVVKMTCEIVVY